MTENMKDFLAKISADAELAKKVTQLDKDALIVLAKELGCELTDADFSKHEGEITMDELEAVTGGEDCLCAIGGGGKRDSDSDPCGCVAAGAGYHDNGDQRCYCMVGGYGDAHDSMFS